MRNNFVRLIFSQWKLRCCSFTKLTSGVHGTIYFDLKFWKFGIFFQNHDVVQNQNSEKDVRLGVRGMWNSKRATPQLSLGKKLMQWRFLMIFKSKWSLKSLTVYPPPRTGETHKWNLLAQVFSDFCNNFLWPSFKGIASPYGVENANPWGGILLGLSILFWGIK